MNVRRKRLTLPLSWLLFRVRARSFVLLLVLLPFPERTALAQTPVLTTTKPPEPAEESTTPACKTDLRLSGSVYDAEHPERSMAVFEVPSSHASAVYRLGSRVGSYELVAVLPRGVFLRGSGGECWLRLVGDPNATQRRVEVKPQPQPKKAKRSKSKAKSKEKKTGAAVVIGGAS